MSRLDLLEVLTKAGPCCREAREADPVKELLTEKGNRERGCEYIWYGSETIGNPEREHHLDPQHRHLPPPQNICTVRTTWQYFPDGSTMLSTKEHRSRERTLAQGRPLTTISSYYAPKALVPAIRAARRKRTRMVDEFVGCLVGLVEVQL